MIPPKVGKLLVRQGDRYLMAAEQDSDPVFGLVHASYARCIFEGLAGQGFPIGNRLELAGAQQERHGAALRRALGRSVTPRGLSEAPREILRTSPRRTL
jgi:hypothetical protein